MDIIHLLPDSVANQIAAGEVVQRPASVIKELMENSIDAGASTIDVIVVDSGKTSIQIIDDGKGMSETDARLAFERHATSKIQKAEDLFSLHTMGFRGEALPSIAAVAQVHLKTRTIEDELGTEIYIEGSKIISQELCACPIGTNFEICNLFFNTRARRKFLKSDQTEMANITQEFQKIALVNPSVSFSLTHNGKLVTSLPAGTVKQRIVNLFGKKFNEQLLPIEETNTTLVKITGFVGKPESACKKKGYQYLFVNGRYMNSSYFHKAVMESFAHIIPDGTQIPYFIYFTVDPATIDVNISPTKTEIKFENEAAIWPIVVAVVKGALGKFNAIPTIEFDTEGMPEDIPVFDKTKLGGVQAPKIQVNTSFNPFASSHAHSQKRTNDWDVLYQGLETSPGLSQEDTLPDISGMQQSLFNEDEAKSMEMSSEHFQFRGQYILTPVQSGLMIVEQHRAHERILYDKFRQQMEKQNAPSQGCLFPFLLTLPPSDAILFEEMTDELHNLGFNISTLGGGSFSILGIPADLGGMDPISLLKEMVETIKEKETGIEDEMRHRIALVMARNAAIVNGQALSSHEMETLISDLFQCHTPSKTPTGKTIMAIMQQTDIDKMF